MRADLSGIGSAAEVIEIGEIMPAESTEILNLLQRVRDGDTEALNEIFTRHRQRLRRMVDMRLDRRLQARIDALATSFRKAMWRPSPTWVNIWPIRVCPSFCGSGSWWGSVC